MDAVISRKFRYRAVVAPAAALTGGIFAVSPLVAQASSVGVVADELPGFAIGDFEYPGADRVLAERGGSVGEALPESGGQAFALLEIRVTR